MDFFLILVALETLSYYPDYDISDWLRENVQWIMFKVFQRKAYDIYGFDTFFSLFLLNFRFLPVFAIVFIAIRLIAMSYWFLFKAIEFKGC